MVLDPHASPGGGRGTLDYGSYIDVSNTVSYATSSVATPHLPSPSELAHNTTSAAQLLLVFRKLSWYLLPVFFLLNMLNYLDRTNLAFASIQMSQDLDLTTVQYGIGSGMQSHVSLGQSCDLWHILEAWVHLSYESWGAKH